MGDVMAVGGQCAEGGPYVIAQHCPEGTTTLMMVGIFGGLLSLVLATWGLMRISSKAASLVILAWGGLFGALGYNFLYFYHIIIRFTGCHHLNCHSRLT